MATEDTYNQPSSAGSTPISSASDTSSMPPPFPTSSTSPTSEGNAVNTGSERYAGQRGGEPGGLGSSGYGAGTDNGSGDTLMADADKNAEKTAEDLMNRVVQGAHDAIDRLAEAATPHVQRLQKGVSSAGDILHTRADQIRETSDEWAETLRYTVRENPMTAVVTALALGMLVSRLTRR